MLGFAEELMGRLGRAGIRHYISYTSNKNTGICIPLNEWDTPGSTDMIIDYLLEDLAAGAARFDIVVNLDIKDAAAAEKWELGATFNCYGLTITLTTEIDGDFNYLYEHL